MGYTIFYIPCNWCITDFGGKVKEINWNKMKKFMASKNKKTLKIIK